MNFQNVCSADMSATFNLIIGVKDLPKPAPKQIWQINTSWAYVVDKDLSVVSGIITLKQLNIAYTEVSDEGALNLLHSLPKLSALDISGTEITGYAG